MAKVEKPWWASPVLITKPNERGLAECSMQYQINGSPVVNINFTKILEKIIFGEKGPPY